MQIDTDELGVLAGMLSAQKMAQLEDEVAKLRKENEYWRQRCDRAEQLQAASVMENMYLKTYITLSAEKIKTFVERLTSIDRFAFLRTFIEWALPKEHYQEQLEQLDKVMPLPDETKPIVEVSSPGNQIIQTQTNNYMNEGGGVGYGE